MYKLYFSCVVFFLCNSTDAQIITLKGQVYDGETKSYIPYATVQLINSMKYCDADENGYFEIDLNNKVDTLFISCIGYKPIKVSSQKLILSDSIFLTKQDITLKEVILLKNEKKVFGILNEKQNTSSTGGSTASRSEITTFIEIPGEIKSYRISKIFIKGRNFKDENPVRLHIYDVDSNGLPGNELLTKEVIISSIEPIDKTAIIDVKDQNIFLEGSGFFVGLQWMTSKKVKIFTGPEIFETVKVRKLLTYRRSLGVNHNNWYAWFYITKGADRSMIFYPGGNPKQEEIPINMLASAEIEIFPQ